MEGNGGAERRAHGGQAHPLEEPAPAMVGDASEDLGIRSLWILVVELEQSAFARRFAAGHEILPVDVERVFLFIC